MALVDRQNEVVQAVVGLNKRGTRIVVSPKILDLGRMYLLYGDAI
jgi:hypothetical protein